MRLRTIVIVSFILIVLIGGIWAFNSAQNSFAVGEGGLPLIKASTTPIKLPPEDPGGETIANADSTVFAVIAGSEKDPSMENLRMPENDNLTDSTEFAGLKTGFSLPSEPEDKVESMFTGEEIKEENRYFAGSLAPSELKEAMEEEVTPEPQLVQETAPPLEEKPAPKPIQVAIPTTGEADLLPAEPIVPIDDDPVSTLKALEAMEKEMMSPPSKPEIEKAPIEKPKMDTAFKLTPPAKPVVKEERKIEPVVQPAAKIVENLIAPTTAPAGYYIQISSTPSQGEAETAWARGKRMHPEILSGLEPRFQPVTIPGKGNYVRVQAGPLPLADAKARCQAVRLANPRGGCLVVRK